MWKSKGCPRCGGDTYLDKDEDGWHEQCLQCAFQRSLVNVAEAKQTKTVCQEPEKRSGSRKKEPQFSRR